MATVTLQPKLDTTHTPFGSGVAFFSLTGTADAGDAVRTSGDGKFITVTNGGLFGWRLNDPGTISSAAIITSVVLTIRHKLDAAASQITLSGEWDPYTTSSRNLISPNFDPPNNTGVPQGGILTSAAFTVWTSTMTVCPATGIAWTTADLFTTGTNDGGPTFFLTYDSGAGLYVIDYLSVQVTYTVPWWKLVLATMTLYFNGAQPSAYTLPFDIYSGGVLYPAGSSIAWTLDSDPGDRGWWVSSDAFAGVVYVVPSTTRPVAPRGFVEVTTFATGATKWAGGFPGVGAVFNNHLVYATGGYTVGTTSPTIRIYDGLTDRPIATLPNTSAGVVPKAIMSMLTANGVVYIATYDSGTTSADWSGRIFSLDIESGVLTPIGTTLGAGHLPYALCWHAGRLWCGSHRQSTAVSGKVFYIRPGIDSDWTADYDLATSTVSSVTSMLSFQGKLYVGTNNAAAAFAKILVRDTAGAYTTSLTLSGGVATAGNGVPALVEFSSALYASYYNADAPVISSIRKYDGSSWTTPYASGTTLVPLIAFPTDGSVMIAVGGGVGISAVVLKTTDGSTWTDQSVYLSQSTPAASGLAAFGTVVH